MANVKVRDLATTQNITNDNKLMILTDEDSNQVKNITIENFIDNINSSDTDNGITIGIDGKLYVDNTDTGVTAGTYAFPQNLEVDSKGRITGIVNGTPASVPIATSSSVGVVKPDNDTIIIDGNGTIACKQNNGYQMFDIVMKDHVLDYAETLGLAPLGTYVYKEAIAGTRYGYPYFYQKCVDEYNASSSIDETFEQPVLTANGTMGGSSFAVEASSYCSSPDRNAYKSFDGNNATKWGVDNTTSGWLTFYNPQALKVSSIVYTPSTDFPGEDGGYLEISGSNDNSTWASLWTGSYTANSTQTFNVDSQAYYNYYRITITNGVSNWIGLGDLTINATYLADYVENSNKHRFYDILDKATFDNMYAITGEAWYYGVDTTDERIFLPRSKRFKNGTSTDVGEYQPAGLPNITGGFGANVFATTYGAFDYTNTIKGNSTGANTEQGQATFDASRSSSIYGASTTVEYSSTKLIPYMVVGNQSTWSGMTDVVNQGMTILSQVNAGLATKLDLDLTNITNSTKSTIAGYAMPSDTYDNLTLGASGTTYTAPANGWFCLYRIPAVGYSNIENLTTGFMTESRNTVNGAGNGVWAPVRKNDIIKLTYDGGTNVTQWRFYYAVGSESEAS